MAYTVVLRRDVVKFLAKLPKKTRARVMEAMEALGAEPRPSGCSKLLGSSDAWRIRVGVYRILYEIQDARLLVSVFRVGLRGDVYR